MRVFVVLLAALIATVVSILVLPLSVIRAVREQLRQPRRGGGR